MKCYIASRFKNRELVKQIAAELASHGFEPLCAWTEEADGMSPALAAARDIRQIEESDMIIVVTRDCESVPGGMHFEAGYAFARNKKVVVIGAAVNIFYQMYSVDRYDDLQQFLAAYAAALNTALDAASSLTRK